MHPTYADLTLTGRHQGPDLAAETTTNVRAPSTPVPGRRAVDAPAFIVDDGGPGFRIHKRGDGQALDGSANGQHWFTSRKEVEQALDDRCDGQAYVVFERSATGERVFDRPNDLGPWFADDTFDRLVAFDNEADAVNYAARSGRHTPSPSVTMTQEGGGTRK